MRSFFANYFSFIWWIGLLVFFGIQIFLSEQEHTALENKQTKPTAENILEYAKLYDADYVTLKVGSRPQFHQSNGGKVLIPRLRSNDIAVERFRKVSYTDIDNLPGTNKCYQNKHVQICYGKISTTIFIKSQG